MFANPFTTAELDRRLAAVRGALVAGKLDAALFASPENVFYLTGLDHWGYFAPHLLIVPLDRRPVLVTRAMERVSVEKQVTVADFRGHSDSETAADVAARALVECGLSGKPLGVERWTSGMSDGLASSLRSQVEARWADVSGLVDRLRLVKSAEEQALMRKAARLSGIAMAATLDSIRDGAAEAEVAARCQFAMTSAGGHPPGFGPFIRPASRLGEEHATWGDGTFHSGEKVFVELSGCVSRYHAPMGRLARLGEWEGPDRKIAHVAERAFEAVVNALRPGNRARDVYAAWQSVVDDAGLSHYRRHHCGYCVGIGFPPSWTGGNTVTGLRAGSDLAIETGMSFHVLSWLMGTGRGDHFLSNTVLVLDNGAEVLTDELREGGTRVAQ